MRRNTLELHDEWDRFVLLENGCLAPYIVDSFVRVVSSYAIAHGPRWGGGEREVMYVLTAF